MRVNCVLWIDRSTLGHGKVVLHASKQRIMDRSILGHKVVLHACEQRIMDHGQIYPRT